MSGIDTFVQTKPRTVDDGIPDPTGWRADIISDAISADDRVRVRVKGLDNGQFEHGPCPFMPRGEALPSKGDRAIVGFDDIGEPYIQVWWPA